MAYDIHTVTGRDALQERREPYFGTPLGSGKYLGVRKLKDNTCVWIARIRDDDGRQRYRSLGQVTKPFDYKAAKQAAEEWFTSFDAGVDDKPLTVAQVCRRYVAFLEAKGRGATAKGDRRKDPAAVPGRGAAHDAEMRFLRTIYNHPIAKVKVEKLRTDRIEEWRNSLGGAESSQNRNLAALKAALNLAVKHSRATATAAQQWRNVEKHKKAGKRRTEYLNLEQRQALLRACEGALRDLVEAAILTGARPGELVRMKRSQFDERTGSVTFTGKTGSRTVPISPPAAALFKRMSASKLPAAPMFTKDDGKPWEHSDWDELLRAAANKAKLSKGVVLYTMRHSFITEALRKGMATLDVARLTGTSLPMIQEHYGHLVEDAARERLAAVQMV